MEKVCSNCEHWEGWREHNPKYPDNIGECAEIKIDGLKAEYVDTPRNFSCNLFKAVKI